jgi:hypothetical protein
MFDFLIIIFWFVLLSCRQVLKFKQIYTYISVVCLDNLQWIYENVKV